MFLAAHMGLDKQLHISTRTTAADTDTWSPWTNTNIPTYLGTASVTYNNDLLYYSFALNQVRLRDVDNSVVKEER